MMKVNFENVKKIGTCLAFIASGLAAIIVGFFMLRGVMHMWDTPDPDHKDDVNESD